MKRTFQASVLMMFRDKAASIVARIRSIRIIIAMLLVVASAGCGNQVGSPKVDQERSPGVDTWRAMVGVYENGRSAASGRLVQASTLSEIKGTAGLDLGHYFEARFSPDGRSIAIFRWPGPEPRNIKLLIVDAATGGVNNTTVTLDAGVNADLFQPTAGGSTVVFVAERRQSADGNAGRSPQDVLRYQVKSRKVFRLATLEKGLRAQKLYLARNGTIVIVGSRYELTRPYINHGSTTVLLLNPDTGKSTEIRVGGVRLGQYDTGTRNTSDFPAHEYYPGIAWDQARGKLYLADSESEAIHVLDVDSRRLERLAMRKPAMIGFLAGLLSVNVAEAKMVPTSRSLLALGSSGKALYISRVRERFVPKKAGEGETYIKRVSSGGVKVIAAASGKHLSTIPVKAHQLLALNTRQGFVAVAGDFEDDLRKDTVFYWDGKRIKPLVKSSDRHKRVTEALYIEGVSPDEKSVYVHKTVTDRRTRLNVRDTIVRIDLVTGKVLAELNPHAEASGSFRIVLPENQREN